MKTSQRKTNNFTYIWNLKNSNKQTKQNRKRLIQRTIWRLPEGRGLWEWAKWAKEIKGYKLPLRK